MSRCRLCISYIVSSLLIGTFIFSLIRNNLHNDVSIRQLRKEIDDITVSCVTNTFKNDYYPLDSLIQYIVGLYQ